MPVICLGRVCIPVAAIAPLFLLLLKPLWEWFQRVCLGRKTKADLGAPADLDERVAATVKRVGMLEEGAKGAAEGDVEVLACDARFDELVGTDNKANNNVVVAEFTAAWCKKCKPRTEASLRNL